MQAIPIMSVVFVFVTSVSCQTMSLHPHSCQKTKPTTNFFGNILPRTGRCGQSCNTDSRVLGGEDAKLGEFPWATLLGYQYFRKKFDFSKNRYVYEKYHKYKCGGTLINTWYVLTAAHCHLEEGKKRDQIHQVVLGEWELPDNSLPGQEGSRLGNKDPDCAGGNSCLPKIQKILVDKVIIHEDYNKTKKGLLFNDIALVRLKTEAVLNDGVQLACLPLNTSSWATRLQIKDFGNGLGGYTGTVIGWGKTSNANLTKGANVGKTILQKAKLALLSMKDCQKMLKHVPLTLDNLGAGGGTDGADSCKGDSGGGLFIKKNTSNHISEQLFGYVQVGLVSFGREKCGIDKPGVYIRVSQYISWIYQNMEP